MIPQKQFIKYAADPAAFRADLLVDVDGSVRRFGEVMDDWQRSDFAAIDPALMKCNGRSDADARMRAFLERPRGHSKTTDIAVACCWALAFSQRPLRGYAFAADRDQARLLKDAVSTILRLNPWVGEMIAVEAQRVVVAAKGHPGEGSILSIETSDVGSSYGILPDLIVADELCHWQGDGSLWHSLFSSAAKRSNCLLLTISNAGFCESWQWQVREAARTDDGWYFSRLDGPQASWMTEKRLEEQRRMLPAVAYRRLWLNEWSTGGGDALTEADINAAFRDGLEPMSGSERGWTFVAGVDLGVSRDASAVVVLAVGNQRTPQQGRIRLAAARLWKPTTGKRVDLIDVERTIRELDRQFRLERVAVDPWQAELLAQRLETDSLHRRRQQFLPPRTNSWVAEVPPTAANLRQIASLTIESFVDRRVQLFDFAPLREDLMKLRVEEKSYGIRLTSPRDGTGHGDTFSAFAVALLVAHEAAGKRRMIVGAMSGSGIDPWEAAMARLDRERDELRREHSRLVDSDPGDDEGWRSVMRVAGRV
jgi:hypothetical protein